ncbi:MAG: hypothetical protein DWQ30_19485 [Acidobacteria bacterium]|nr:MAG: hypothetical protein DWQ30_19485 [Acidobacteriota bacterium]
MREACRAARVDSVGSVERAAALLAGFEAARPTPTGTTGATAPGAPGIAALRDALANAPVTTAARLRAEAELAACRGDAEAARERMLEAQELGWHLRRYAAVARLEQPGPRRAAALVRLLDASPQLVATSDEWLIEPGMLSAAWHELLGEVGAQDEIEGRLTDSRRFFLERLSDAGSPSAARRR